LLNLAEGIDAIRCTGPPSTSTTPHMSQTASTGEKFMEMRQLETVENNNKATLNELFTKMWICLRMELFQAVFAGFFSLVIFLAKV